MNIFCLDFDPEQAARWHVDKHVVKMPLEYAQLLSTAHFVLDNRQVGYKPTHKNHPSATWARFSASTYSWLYELFLATSVEYKYRYCRTHRSFEDLHTVLSKPPTNISDRGFVPPFMAMPVEYWHPGQVVESYRDYYNRGKRDLHCWSYRDPPPWITPHEEV